MSTMNAAGVDPMKDWIELERKIARGQTLESAAQRFERRAKDVWTGEAMAAELRSLLSK